MIKKLVWLLVICILLLVAGGFLYWKLSRSVPPRPNAATNWPATVPASPSLSPTAPAGPTSGPPAAAESPSKKGIPSTESDFVLRPGETLEYDANLTKLNSTVANLKDCCCGETKRRG